MDLEQLRGEIDEIDRELLDLFLRRMDIVQRIAAHKLEQGLPVLHPEREAAVLEARSKQAGAELAPYAREFFQSLMDTSKKLQQKMMDGE